MTLPGNASVPGADSRLQRMAFQAGQQVSVATWVQAQPDTDIGGF